MIIDYTGKKGINWFGRTYANVLGHNIKRNFKEAFIGWLEFDLWRKLILGEYYLLHKDKWYHYYRWNKKKVITQYKKETGIKYYKYATKK